jgi:hypothetical protein
MQYSRLPGRRPRQLERQRSIEERQQRLAHLRDQLLASLARPRLPVPLSAVVRDGRLLLPWEPGHSPNRHRQAFARLLTAREFERLARLPLERH